jgi:hypothetical protein
MILVSPGKIGQVAWFILIHSRHDVGVISRRTGYPLILRAFYRQLPFRRRITSFSDSFALLSIQKYCDAHAADRALRTTERRFIVQDASVRPFTIDITT